MTNESTPDDHAVAAEPPAPIGLARLAKMAFDGVDLGPLWDA